MTGVTAYASLVLMMGLAARLSVPAEGRGGARPAAAAVWVVLLSLAGSLRPALLLLLGPNGADRLLSSYRGLAAWTDQASWVPQHLASACCVVLAVLVLADLAERRRTGAVLILGALAAAAFGSSAWVGGVTFAFAAAGVGVVGLLHARGRGRLWLLAAAAGAAGFALVLALPLLHAEFGALAARRGGAPVAFHPYEVLGAVAPAGLRRALDYPAYWLVLLPIDLAAIYPVGMAALALGMRGARRRAEGRVQVLSLAVLTVAGLLVSSLLASTIGNNDLGWRAILPAVLVLTPFAAAALSRWIETRAYVPAALALALFAASVPDRQVIQNIKGRRTENAPDFAAAPALWAAVRRHAGPDDRVANNPGFLDDLTDWPVNPSWAMLSNRPSCYSGWETARAYVDLPVGRTAALEAQFDRVFDGRSRPDDLRQMARDYGCKVVALVSSDGAWDHDPFAASPDYRLAEQRADQWRIYVATSPASARR